MNGAVYPKDGPMDIVKGICSTIEQNGGIILTKARATQIVLDLDEDNADLKNIN